MAKARLESLTMESTGSGSLTFARNVTGNPIYVEESVPYPYLWQALDPLFYVCHART